MALSLTTEQLLERPDLVAIDGILYDLEGLAKVHPGGDLILASGASDASPLFYSMHPYVKPENSKLLQQFVRGKHDRTSKDIVYTYDSPFAQDVKRTMREVMKGRNWYATPGFWLRTVGIIAVTAFCEWHWATTGMVLWGLLTGFMHMQIGLSIQHDASHGAISKKPWVNALFAYGIDVIGSSRWIWLQSHIMRHHTYTNQHGLDLDAESAEPFLVFHNYPAANTARKWFHRFQAWYMYLVLGAYGVSLVYNPLYIFRMQHNDTIPESVTAMRENGFLRRYRTLAFVMRAFFIFRTAFLPWYLTGTSLLITIPLVPTATGAFLTFFFILSHNFDGSERIPDKNCKVKSSEKDVEADQIDWYRAQVETSSTYGGPIAMFFTGGLNFQIEHHLFPRMSSWHYPFVQQAVRECCERHGVRYVFYPTIVGNIISTLKYMHKVGVVHCVKDAQDS
eukprot:EG_transcript_6226